MNKLLKVSNNKRTRYTSVAMSFERANNKGVGYAGTTKN